MVAIEQTRPELVRLPKRLYDLIRGEVTHAYIARLAGLNDIAIRKHELVDRHVEWKVMDLVEVDVIRV